MTKPIINRRKRVKAAIPEWGDRKEKNRRGGFSAGDRLSLIIRRDLDRPHAVGGPSTRMDIRSIEGDSQTWPATPWVPASGRFSVYSARGALSPAFPTASSWKRFLDGRDEAAFTALVGRHGPMVLGTCRAVLRDPDDAEDAFQATFLVLVCKARSIRGRGALGGWLHQVAHRIAIQAGTEAARKRRRERSSPLWI